MTIREARSLDPAGSEAALRQVADFVRHGTGVEISIAADGRAFQGTRADEGPGIVSVSGRLTDELLIALKVELVRLPHEIRVPVMPFFACLSGLGERTRPIPPAWDRKTERASLGLELKIQPAMMSLSRGTAFMSELKTLDKLARTLQAEMPLVRTDSDLVQLYKDFSEAVEPIYPWHGDAGSLGSDLVEWARETMDLLSGSASLAISASFPVVESFGLAVLARAARDSGSSLGRVISTSINSRAVVEVSKKVPGKLVIPASCLSLGSNPYELGSEIKALMATLSSLGACAIFSGSFDQLQAVFHGGQGGTSDPLNPILRRVPDATMDVLTPFAVQSAARLAGGLSKSQEDQVAREVLAGIEGMAPPEQKRLLPIVATRSVNAAHQKTALMVPTLTFASAVAGLSETFAGLSCRPRSERAPSTQACFVRALADPGLLAHLQEHLLAQDAAIEQLVARLRMECLTRPLHQPIRYCAQGTPGTGKSESAVLIAQRLGIPYVNVDAASIPDYYSAAAQLLGSGRGIVGSYQSGRLEQAAKHHTGALIEVSDLDHANERVRAGLADLFLQVLETGEAQSTAGAMFSCANLIFAFTMNLPDGMDEAVRKGIGFENVVPAEAVAGRVNNEIKRMLSSAFLSRVGTPILFEPLSGDALAAILERAIRAALLSATERLHLARCRVILEQGLGAALLKSLHSNMTSFGARALLERGRSLAAESLLRLHQSGAAISGATLFARSCGDGVLAIDTVRAPSGDAASEARGLTDHNGGG
ncbi:MAG: AAA family ATPase [Acidobacteriota bacterium]